MLSLTRIIAIVKKEFLQMKRDRISMGMIFTIPLIQLVLFGFAINTNPKHLPTAIVSADQSAYTRAFVTGLKNTTYFEIVDEPTSMKAANDLLAKGKVLFVIYIPADFTYQMIRNNKPEILIEADATDAIAINSALSALKEMVKNIFDKVAPHKPIQLSTQVNYIVHAKYNPESITQYHIVPGLLGVVLTMTLVMVTSMAITRDNERGTIESLLTTPVLPIEIMIGKIIPYILVGYIQMIIILLFAVYLFHVPIQGNLWLLLMAALPFIGANLAVGLTFSSIAKNQLQAMQMAFFFFLPSILLSGFMFPFYGLPLWAQKVGSILPLTYFLRIVRGVILKGNNFSLIWHDIWPMIAFMVVVLLIAIKEYRKTLD